MGCGDLEAIETMGRKMSVLELTKKFTFNNEAGKTEIMKMSFQSKRKKVKVMENPKVEVKKGLISMTELYKYLGDWYNETGSNMFKIDKKMKKLDHIISEIKIYSAYEKVGRADTFVRMMLLDVTVQPSLLFSTETWVGITKDDQQLIQKYHYTVLRKSFEQKQGTPYWGIIAETGIWPYVHVIAQKQLMLLHQMINSDEERVARKIIVNQIEKERSGGNDENWFTAVKRWADRIGIEIDVEEMKEVSKDEWNSRVKDRMESEISKEVMDRTKTMTKLRFIRKFELQDYIKKCSILTVKKIMKVRLNMVEISENFRGRYDHELCAACNAEKETTEHVIKCKQYKKITGHDMRDQDNHECFSNTEWLIEAAEVFERIEETRSMIC
jgi:hypothetical protein